MRKLLLDTARSAAITVIIVALFPACSSQPSRNPEKPKTGRALQAEEARLASKAKTKDEAMVFVRLAQDACRELTRKTAALEADSTGDSQALASFIPPELYPTDAFAAYVDQATFADVKSQLTQLTDSLVGLLRSLERSRKPSITRSERQPGEERAALQQEKLKTLTSIDIYCESVRRAGAGLRPLR